MLPTVNTYSLTRGRQVVVNFIDGFQLWGVVVGSEVDGFFIMGTDTKQAIMFIPTSSIKFIQILSQERVE